jgi:hypothetical protein
MNNPDESLSDKTLGEALAPLRSVTVSEEIHESNLAAVHQALACQIQPQWWRRSVTVPLPLAIAATLVFVLTAGALFKPLIVPGRAHEEAPSQSQAELANNDSASKVRKKYEEAPVWSKTQSYIHSLVNSPVLDTSTLKETRDDS